MKESRIVDFLDSLKSLSRDEFKLGILIIPYTEKEGVLALVKKAGLVEIGLDNPEFKSEIITTIHKGHPMVVSFNEDTLPKVLRDILDETVRGDISGSFAMLIMSPEQYDNSILPRTASLFCNLTN